MSDAKPEATEPPKDAAPAAPAGAETSAAAAGDAHAAGHGDGHGGAHGGKPNALKEKLSKLGPVLKEKVGALVHGLKDLPKNFVPAMKGLLRSLLQLPLLLVHGDLMTRLVLLGFVASVAVLAITGRQLLSRFAPSPTAEHGEGHGEGHGDAHGHDAEHEQTPEALSENILFLERFSANLVSDVERIKTLDIELYVEADSPETRAVLKANLQKVRETISNTIQGQKYDTLISEAGKAELRQKLIEALNKGLKRWSSEHSGKVKKVFFTTFIMG